MFNWFKKKKKNQEEEKIKEEEFQELEEEIESIKEEIEELAEEERGGDQETVSEAPHDSQAEETSSETLASNPGETSPETKASHSEDISFPEEPGNNLNDSILESEEAIIKEEEIFPVKEKPPAKKPSFFDKLKTGLTRTRDDITNKIDGILKSYKKIDEELFEDLEEVLITADVGMNTTMDLIDRLRARVKEDKVSEPEEVKELLKDEINKLMEESIVSHELNIEPSPAVVLVVGVNGVGKTTTIGKLSNNYKLMGKKVLIAAGDTFRAAAIEQLEEWGNRAGVDVISHNEGADPAAVIFDGIQAAKARKSDILICDTAGRLHNKSNLMNELNKIFRVVEKEYGDASKEVLLVLDATTGQNAINQAKVFKEVANITGIALTKLDGTAKGGVVIALQSELGIPVKLVGVGEGIEDLQPFNGRDFVEAIFG